MGISIQYKGQLTDTRKIYDFILEAKEIAESMDWDYDILDQEWRRIPTARFESTQDGGIRIAGNTCLKGIQIIPHPKCEPIWLFFTAVGYLSTPFHIALDAEELYPERKIWITSVTHYAGVQTHISVIKFLKHLKKKYVHDLEVVDDGDYWDTEDEAHLEKKINNLNRMMAMTDEALMRMVRERDKDKEDPSDNI